MPPMAQFPEPPEPGSRRRLYQVIFEHDTAPGRAFDVALLVVILASVAAVMLESVREIADQHGAVLRVLEWGFTGLFSVEYVLRLACVKRPAQYARSFYGVVDLLSVAPTYLALIIPGAQSLLVIRALRLLRVFRILKLGHFMGEAEVLVAALRASGPKIIVFIYAVLTIVMVMSTSVYLVEGAASGFTSIPRAVYWGIVTMTTVGYGDIAPQTVAGQIMASMIMISGYGIIAVPTGIVSVELGRAARGGFRACPACAATGHDPDANYCKRCGAELPEKERTP